MDGENKPRREARGTTPGVDDGPPKPNLLTGPITEVLNWGVWFFWSRPKRANHPDNPLYSKSADQNAL